MTRMIGPAALLGARVNRRESERTVTVISRVKSGRTCRLGENASESTMANVC